MINDFDVKITGTPNKGLRIIGDELNYDYFYFILFLLLFRDENRTVSRRKQAIKHFQKKTNASKQEITF